ncbi:MAG: zinc ABC transporter substrate-binding protein [Deltaproteobacteria bacterium]|nr:zinc ABC transporter substrate-binding protein [Deltaproteobacteria bacterium]
MSHLLLTFVAVAAVFQPPDAAAAVKIVTSIPDFAQIAREIGGERVETVSLVQPTQDPHFVDARPSFAVDLADADLLIYAGAELEAGWLPPLIRTADNARIQPGATGHLNVAAVVPLKDVPTGAVDRSQGDVHPQGNPHTWTDPRNGLRVAVAITQRLKAIDPDGSDAYESGLRDFARRLGDRMTEWKELLKPFAGTKVIVYHPSWVYFLEWAGFEEVGTIEPLPGVPPSDSDVVALVEAQAGAGVRLVVGESFHPSDRIEFVADGLSARALVLPVMTGADGCTTSIDLIDHLVREVVQALP